MSSSIALIVFLSAVAHQALTITLSPAQKLTVETITNIFEHGRVAINYADCENLHDGQGLSAGRAGVTTAAGDVLVVLKAYSGKCKADFDKYMPRLEEVAAANSDSDVGLDGFCDLWNKCAAEDEAFRQVQDDQNDSGFYQPALAMAAKEGVNFQLSMSFLYDTCINHGTGDDAKSLGGIVAAADAAVGGSVGSGRDEAQWLAAAIAARKQVLIDLGEPHATTAVWRMGAFSKLLSDGQTQLQGTVHVQANTIDIAFACSDTACEQVTARRGRWARKSQWGR